MYKVLVKRVKVEKKNMCQENVAKQKVLYAPGCAPALKFLVHFFAVLYKTTT